MKLTKVHSNVLLGNHQIYVGDQERSVTGDEIEDSARIGLSLRGPDENIAPLPLAVAVSGLYRRERGEKETNSIPNSVELVNSNRRPPEYRVKITVGDEEFTYDVNVLNLEGHLV